MEDVVITVDRYVFVPVSPMLAELCKSLPADSHCACFRQRVTLIGVKAVRVTLIGVKAVRMTLIGVKAVRVTLIGFKAVRALLHTEGDIDWCPLDTVQAVRALVELVYCGFAPLDQEIPPMTLQPALE